MTIKQLREYLRETYGPWHYRITGENEIHVYGQMPNSIETGWWLYGYLEDFIKQ